MDYMWEARERGINDNLFRKVPSNRTLVDGGNVPFMTV